MNGEMETMFGKHHENHAAALSAAATCPRIDPDAPARACCCPARPAVKVIIPPGSGRSRPADLWLCGHHYRLSRVALAACGAEVAELSATEALTRAGAAEPVAA